MEYKKFIAKFNKQVFSIDFDKQLSLAIDVCKRLYFDYTKFSEKYKWGDNDTLMDAITILEESKNQECPQSIIDQALIRVDAITPDIETFESDELVSYALNACVAVHNSLEFLIDKLPERIYDVGICLTDTIDFKIQEERCLTEQEIDKNPLMVEVREYLIQKSK